MFIIMPSADARKNHNDNSTQCSDRQEAKKSEASVSRDELRVLNHHGHHQLPAQLLGRVSKVRERRPHECGPEDNGQVAGVHLVQLLLLLDLVEVLHQVAEGSQVGLGHAPQDLVQSRSLGVGVQCCNNKDQFYVSSEVDGLS